MVLNKEYVTILKGWGYTDTDIKQIKMAIGKTIYIHEGKKISSNRALQILGTTEFLSGISRSAFHFSAGRKNNGEYVSFNSRKLYT